MLLRKMYIQLLGGVYMSGSSGCFIVLFVFSLSLLIFCMVVLSIIDSGVSESPAIVVETSVSLSMLSVFAACVLER